MTRERNLFDLENQKLRRHFHNPLFHLLTDEIKNAFLESGVPEDYILDHYYVDDRDDVDVTNKVLLSHFPRGVKIIKKSADLVERIEEPEGSGLVFLLIGKKGIGKTILLKYYMKVVKSIDRGKTVVIYLNLRTKKRDDNFKSALPKSLLEVIFDQLMEDKQVSKYLTRPYHIRKLHPSYRHIRKSSLGERILDHKPEAINYLFNYLKSQGSDLILIIDNIDDFGEQNVKKIIDKCEDMKVSYNAKCIVAVRDYWTPQRLGIDDSKLSSMHLGKPNINNIIKRRLEAIDTDSIFGSVEITFGGEYDKPIRLTSVEIIDTYNMVVEELLGVPNSLQNLLFQLTNYNTRDFLQSIYYFFSSPYLFSRPNFTKTLISRARKTEDISHEKIRSTHFFDFIESFMTPNALCYDFEESNIFNIFFHNWDYREGYNYKNTLIFVRILQSVPERKRRTIKKDTIVNKLEMIGYADEKATKKAISILLKEALLESPNGICYDDSEDITLSDKGKVYLNRVITEYSYIVYVSDAVPMPEKYRVDVYQKFGNEKIPLEKGDLHLKFDSVRKFVKFIKEEEEEEQRKCPNRSVLDMIKGQENIWEKIERGVENVIYIMQRAPPRKTQKIVAVKFRP